MANQRAKKVEYMKRVFMVQGWIIEGVPSSLICRQILNDGGCKSQRHAERILKAARDLWTDIPEAALEQKRKLKIVELQQLQRNLKEQYKGTPAGIRALMSIQKEIIMLEGLRKPTKVELTGKDGQPIQTENTKVHFYLPKNGRDTDESTPKNN